MKKTLLINRIEDLPSIAKEFFDFCENGKKIAFYGDMGAGKTTLIKALAKSLGSPDNVSSPTFSIINEYDSPNGSLYHMDLYRLDSLEEVLDIGIENYLDSDSFCFIEWPELIEGLFDEEIIRVRIRESEHGTRILEMSKG